MKIFPLGGIKNPWVRKPLVAIMAVVIPPLLPFAALIDAVEETWKDLKDFKVIVKGAWIGR